MLRMKLVEKAEFGSLTLQLCLWTEQQPHPDNRRNGSSQPAEVEEGFSLLFWVLVSTRYVLW